MRARRAVRWGLGAAVLVLSVSACVTTLHSFPPPGLTPEPAGDATDATREQIIAALAAVGLQATEALRAYRPTEGPLLAGAPRSVVEVALPDDPSQAFVVVYAFPSSDAAAAAAQDHAAYVSSGIGRINFPRDAQFSVRVAGSTVVFFWWSPGAATDPRTRSIEEALLTVGTGVVVPS